MITDPLHVGLDRARCDSLSRGFSHHSSPHTSPRFEVMTTPARGSRGTWPGSHFSTIGLRLSLSLPCNDSTGVVQWGQEAP